ncbi:hypothetical protein [Sharpea azabuensis]|uniref:hypothetical protein n=1 Tax=Sharpea azabuensis TaxID=322505 RepID=UPI0013DCB38B|nr:hypothetical protein [Sharpea azabuensis]MEE3309276.1 hypothetical protein [Sharpea azabuensis]
MDEFYRNLYLDFIFIYLQSQFSYEQVKIFTSCKTYCRRVIYEIDDLKGCITLWHNHIIEEQITRNDKTLFYLHYRFNNLAQFTSLFRDFRYAFMNMFTSQNIHIGIVSQDGLSAAPFVQILQEVLKYEESPIVIEALDLEQARQNTKRYTALYLAPQLKEDYPAFLNTSTPTYMISPLIYATHDSLSMLTQIKEKIRHQS